MPKSGLPEVFGQRCGVWKLPAGTFQQQNSYTGVAGDQQASAISQVVFPRRHKSTYGTGAFLLVNTGEQATYPKISC